MVLHFVHSHTCCTVVKNIQIVETFRRVKHTNNFQLVVAAQWLYNSQDVFSSSGFCPCFLILYSIAGLRRLIPTAIHQCEIYARSTKGTAAGRLLTFQASSNSIEYRKQTNVFLGVGTLYTSTSVLKYVMNG